MKVRLTDSWLKREGVRGGWRMADGGPSSGSAAPGACSLFCLRISALRRRDCSILAAYFSAINLACMGMYACTRDARVCAVIEASAAFSLSLSLRLSHSQFHCCLVMLLQLTGVTAASIMQEAKR